MRIVINLTFDANAEAAIRQLWQNLEIGLAAPQLQASTRYPPHITLTVYEATDVVPYTDTMQRLLPHFSPFPLKLDVLGIFPEANVLFLAARMTRTLMGIHQETIEAFEDQPVAAHLLPNHWQPHCTLVSGLTQEQIIEAVKLCQANWTPIEAKCIGIGIRVIPEKVHHWHGLF